MPAQAGDAVQSGEMRSRSAHLIGAPFFLCVLDFNHCGRDAVQQSADGRIVPIFVRIRRAVSLAHRAPTLPEPGDVASNSRQGSFLWAGG
jgi:hypothetical protein